jgi:hypothetical protein
MLLISTLLFLIGGLVVSIKITVFVNIHDAIAKQL